MHHMVSCLPIVQIRPTLQMQTSCPHCSVRNPGTLTRARLPVRYSHTSGLTRSQGVRLRNRGASSVLLLSVACALWFLASADGVDVRRSSDTVPEVYIQMMLLVTGP